VARPPCRLWLTPDSPGRKRERESEVARRERVENLKFRIRFIWQRLDPRGRRGDDDAGAEIPGGTVSARARHCRPLVYEPGVRFRRGDSILLATIYSAGDLTYAYTRARINYGRYPGPEIGLLERAFFLADSRAPMYSRGRERIIRGRLFAARARSDTNELPVALNR